MKTLPAAIVVGSLALIGSLSSATAQPVALNASIQSIADSDTPADRGNFMQQTRDVVGQWQTRLQAFREKVAAAGDEAGKAAANDLDKAWARTQAASRRLQTAGDEGWESAKASYDKTTRDLASAWRKLGHRE